MTVIDSHAGRVHTGRMAASRAIRSARGRRMYGVSLAPTWRRANYAYPYGVGGDRGIRPSYPIDPRHVFAARAYAARRNTAGSLAYVDRALRRRYGSVPAALTAARRSIARRQPDARGRGTPAAAARRGNLARRR